VGAGDSELRTPKLERRPTPASSLIGLPDDDHGPHQTDPRGGIPGNSPASCRGSRATTFPAAAASACEGETAMFQIHYTPTETPVEGKAENRLRLRQETPEPELLTPWPPATRFRHPDEATELRSPAATGSRQRPDHQPHAPQSRQGEGVSGRDDVSDGRDQNRAGRAPV